MTVDFVQGNDPGTIAHGAWGDQTGCAAIGVAYFDSALTDHAHGGFAGLEVEHHVGDALDLDVDEILHFVEGGQNLGLGPVLLEPSDTDPATIWVTQAEGGEGDRAGNDRPADGCDGIDTAIDLVAGLGVVAVVGVGPDEVGEAEAAFFGGCGHDVGGLLLAVFRA